MNLSEFVAVASPEAVLEGLVKVKALNLPESLLIPYENSFNKNVVSTINQHFRGETLIDPEDLKSYLAASVILHTFDGWHYLSASVNSLLNGDTSIAVHLAYYAELRAAISLLSNEGFGIFNKKHFCINEESEIIKHPGRENYPTHQFVWDLLKEWAINTKQCNVLQYFRYNGKSFFEWLNYIPFINSEKITSLLVKEWLTKWCLDIKEIEEDRESRNILSYRPFQNRISTVPTIQDKNDVLNSFWKILEPNVANRFATLDKYLFSTFLNRIHSEISNLGIDCSKERLIDDIFKGAKIPVDMSLKMIVESNLSHSILDKAKVKSLNEDELPDPLAIIARAILMLRVATGATSYLLKSANVSKQELKFYINKVGIEGGFWNRDEMPEDFCDLWTDIDNLINDFDDLSSDPDLTLKKLNDQKFNISTYSQFNRAAVWGMGL